MDVRFRPWTWVGPGTPPDKRRSRYTFKAEWSATLDLLDRELYMIGASDIVIECGLREQDIRTDGWPKQKYNQPEHPGVRLSFASKFGPLQYATDTFETLAANLRAIALSLEALRKIDRYGVSRRGEQYTGWKALPAGSTPAPPPPAMSREDAITTILRLAKWSVGDPLNRAGLIRPGDLRDTIFARARRLAHPDTGGSDEEFKLYQQAERVLMGQKTLTAP